MINLQESMGLDGDQTLDPWIRNIIVGANQPGVKTLKGYENIAIPVVAMFSMAQNNSKHFGRE